MVQSIVGPSNLVFPLPQLNQELDEAIISYLPHCHYNRICLPGQVTARVVVRICKAREGLMNLKRKI